MINIYLLQQIMAHTHEIASQKQHLKHDCDTFVYFLLLIYAYSLLLLMVVFVVAICYCSMNEFI